MDERSLLLGLLRLAMREIPANAPLAHALIAWCRANAAALGLPDEQEEPEQAAAAPRWRLLRRREQERPEHSPDRAWAQLGQALAAAKPEEAANSALLATTARLAGLLGLGALDARLLQIVVAVDRLRLAGGLCGLLQRHGLDVATLVSELAGLDSLEALRQTEVMQLGLVELSSSRDGEVTIDATAHVHRVLNRAPLSGEMIIECLVGAAAPARLDLADFAMHGEQPALLCRLLQSALASRLQGINLLLYGPPGTGKTELAKSLAAAAGARLHAVGEADEFGEEPARWERVNALTLAQRVLASRSDVVLLFDEMEDLIGDAERAATDSHFSRRVGSKVYLNRLFETNAVPTIWTTNAIENVDAAYLRRMTYIMKMDLPAPAARARIIHRIARDEGVELSPAAAARLAAVASESTTVARTALRTARMLQSGEAETGRVLQALVAGVRHGRPVAPDRRSGSSLDLALYQSDTSIAALFDRLSASDAPLDFSLLLTGPPGTGKTALAHHLAQRLDRPLVVKRTSDLLSKWVGGTERHIAHAFAEAAESGSILLFDEVDSLLFDRSTAERSWEVSQVNELLTWMDSHPLPFIAATNHAGRLDSAALRRFVFKVKLEALGPAAAAKAFQTFFRRSAPPRLVEIAGLTPGDFAVVAGQLRFRPEPASDDVLVDLLAREAAAKPGLPGRIGFRLAPGDA